MPFKIEYYNSRNLTFVGINLFIFFNLITEILYTSACKILLKFQYIYIKAANVNIRYINVYFHKRTNHPTYMTIPQTAVIPRETTIPPSSILSFFFSPLSSTNRAPRASWHFNKTRYRITHFCGGGASRAHRLSRYPKVIHLICARALQRRDCRRSGPILSNPPSLAL